MFGITLVYMLALSGTHFSSRPHWYEENPMAYVWGIAHLTRMFICTVGEGWNTNEKMNTSSTMNHTKSCIPDNAVSS